MFSYRKASKWKYITCSEYKCYVGIVFGGAIEHPFIKIKSGFLYIKEGYSWDGASFFPDIMTIMRGSLVHDALYQLMREGLLHNSRRKKADNLLRFICREDGMNKLLSDIVYYGVRFFAGYAARPKE